jgi:flagellar biogenesis protein FliO
MDIANGPVDQLVAINSQIVQYVAVLLALAGVLVLAYVTLKIGLPRIFGMTPSAHGPMRVLARFPLEPRKTLYLMEMGSQVFLLASSDNNVTYLTAVDPENVAQIIANERARTPARKEFRQLLTWLQRSEGSE